MRRHAASLRALDTSIFAAAPPYSDDHDSDAGGRQWDDERNPVALLGHLTALTKLTLAGFAQPPAPAPAPAPAHGATASAAAAAAPLLLPSGLAAKLKALSLGLQPGGTLRASLANLAALEELEVGVREGETEEMFAVCVCLCVSAAPHPSAARLQLPALPRHPSVAQPPPPPSLPPTPLSNRPSRARCWRATSTAASRSSWAAATATTTATRLSR